MDWMEVTEDRDRQRALVNAVMWPLTENDDTRCCRNTILTS
jgi:hypothetical protein